VARPDVTPSSCPIDFSELIAPASCAPPSLPICILLADFSSSARLLETPHPWPVIRLILQLFCGTPSRARLECGCALGGGRGMGGRVAMCRGRGRSKRVFVSFEVVRRSPFWLRNTIYSKFIQSCGCRDNIWSFSPSLRPRPSRLPSYPSQRGGQGSGSEVRALAKVVARGLVVVAVVGQAESLERGRVGAGRGQARVGRRARLERRGRGGEHLGREGRAPGGHGQLQLGARGDGLEVELRADGQKSQLSLGLRHLKTAQAGQAN